MTSFIANVPTIHAGRYLQQLCKHWSHKFEVNFTPDAGVIALPFGPAHLSAGPEALTIRLDLADATAAERAQTVVAEHLNRFAFREVPLEFSWTVA